MCILGIIHLNTEIKISTVLSLHVVSSPYLEAIRISHRYPIGIFRSTGSVEGRLFALIG